MSNDVTINVKVTDAASATLGKVGTNTESMATKAGAAVTKLGNQIGGELGDMVSRGGEALESFGESGKSMGVKLGSAGAAVAGLGLAMSAFGSGEKAAEQQLDAAVSAAGQSVDDYSGQIDKAVDKGADFGHSAKDVDQALSVLVETTGDTQVAVDHMNLVFDLAAAKHESVAAAASQVAKVLGGNTKLLKQYGIDIDGATASLSDLNGGLTTLGGKLQGQASAQADTFDGKVQALEAHAKDLASNYANNLGPSFTVVGTAATIAGAATYIYATYTTRASKAQRELTTATTETATSEQLALFSTEELTVGENALTVSSTKATAAQAGLATKLGLVGGYVAIAVAGYEASTKAVDESNTVTKKFGGTVGSVYSFLASVNGWGAESLKWLNNWVSGSNSSSAATQQLAAAQAQLAAQDAATTEQMQNQNKAVGTLSDSFGAQGKAIDTVTQAYKEIQNPAEDALKQNNAFDDSIDSLTGGIATAKTSNDKFATSLDTGTAAGRKNNEAVLSIIDNINQMTEQSQQSGDTVNETNSKLAIWNGTLVDAAKKAGINSDALQGMINTYENNPKTLAYQVTVDANQALTTLTTLQGKMAYTDALKGVNPAAYASLFQAEAPGSQTQYAHGGIPGAATGGNRNGVIQWGEQGREMAKLPNGSYVMSGPDTQSALAGAGGQQTVIVQLEVVGSGDLTDLIRKSVRVKGGGNVQVAFGTSS